METQLDEINSVREKLQDGEIKLKKELRVMYTCRVLPKLSIVNLMWSNIIVMLIAGGEVGIESNL